MNILFLGAGNMSKAIVFAMLDKMNYNPKEIIVYDKTESQYEEFIKRNVIAARNISEAIEVSDVIFFAVKPQNMDGLLGEMKSTKLELGEKLYVSICASITTEYIKRKLALNVPVIRIMPNTALMAGLGVSAICRNEFVTNQEFDFICKIFGSLGKIMILDESKMNSVIPINASSPAIVYKLAGAMIDSAVKLGFCEQEMSSVVTQVFAGAVKMLGESGKTPGELIKMVASQKGTTEKALAILDENNFNEIITKSMIECALRANELTKEICD